jgi:hypothetical protein
MPKKIRGEKTRPSLLVFAGALIVFVTFIVKEGIAEKYKNSVAVLDEARSFFGLREDIIHLRRLIVDVATVAVPKPKAVVQEVTFENEGHQFIEDDLEGISQFMNRIETSEDFSHRLDLLRQELLQEAKRDQEMQDELWGTNGKERKTIDEIEAALKAQVPVNIRISQEYRQLKRDLIDAAKRERDRNERFYEVSKWTAIVLYTIGWGLGLRGKVYGDTGVEEA